MKHLMAAVVIVSLISIGIIGCNDATKSSAKQQTKITTPGGTTTLTTEQQVNKTGENPPGTTL